MPAVGYIRKEKVLFVCILTGRVLLVMRQNEENTCQEGKRERKDKVMIFSTEWGEMKKWNRTWSWGSLGGWVWKWAGVGVGGGPLGGIEGLRLWTKENGKAATGGWTWSRCTSHKPCWEDNIEKTHRFKVFKVWLWEARDYQEAEAKASLDKNKRIWHQPKELSDVFKAGHLGRSSCLTWPVRITGEA